MLSAEEKSWPKWLMELDDKIPKAINDIEYTKKFLYKSCKKPHIYPIVSQLQTNYYYGRILNQTSEETVSDIINRKGIFKDKRAIIIQLYNFSKAFHQLQVLNYSKKIICLKLLDGIIYGFNDGNFIVALPAIRCIIEHIAHLNFTLSNINNLGEPQNNQEAFDIWAKYSEQIRKKLYATRIDWPALTQAKFAKDKARKFHYKKTKYYADMEAEDLMKSVDSLNKRVKGARLAYDVLSEFLHPNYGTVYAVTESFKAEKDRFDINWQKRIIGFDFPNLMPDMNKQIVIDVFLVFSETFCLLKNLMSEGEVIENKLLKVIQICISDAIKNFNLFGRNDKCPCGSGLKFKKCCGLS